MKRLLILLILAIVAGLALGPWIKGSAGTVILILGEPSAEHTTVRLRLWFAVALVGLAVAALLLAWRFLRGTGLVVAGGAGLSANMRHRRARKQTIAGMIALAEGHWAQAEKAIVAGSTASEVPLLSFLMAAQAAQMQKAGERRDEYLRQAALAEPEAQVAVGLTQAQLQLQHGQKELALATLNHVRALAPKHPYVLKLLKRLHVQFEDWPALVALLPELNKHKLLAEDERLALEARAHGVQLAREATHGLTALQACWQAMPKEAQGNPALLAQYARRLQDAGAGAAAEELVRGRLKKQFEPALAEVYGELVGPEAGKQLSTAEAWLKPETRSAGFLLALARLAMRSALWGKARQYLEDALNLGAGAPAWWLLAQVHEQMGERSAAETCYRRGLAVSLGESA